MFVLKIKPTGTEMDGTGEKCYALPPEGDVAPSKERPNGTRDVRKEQAGDKSADTSKKEIVLWHQRLGHMSAGKMDQVREKKLIKGVTYKKEDLPACRGCLEGRQPRKPFKRKTRKTTTRPLELWHVDLCEAAGESIGKSRYALVIIDDYTRYVWCSYLKEKSQAVEAIEAHRKREERLTGLQLERRRTDNGREFCNQQSKEIWLKEGIRHETTVPYTPQSNGVVERYNRSLIEKTRTLLKQSLLPDRFWAKTWATATYMINRTPTAGEPGMTPYEKKTGRKPVSIHLRVFGCAAHRHIPKQIRSKFDSVTKKGIMVGYATNKLAYRIYDEDEDRVYEARDVFFEEGRMGSRVQMRRAEELQMHADDVLNGGEAPETGRHGAPEAGERSEGEDDSSESEAEAESGDETQVQRAEALQPQQNEQRQPGGRGRPPNVTQEERRERHKAEIERREQELIGQGVRRSERIRSKHTARIAVEKELLFTPRTYKEAIECKDSGKWKEAMEKEMRSLDTHKVWKLEDRAKNKKAIGCKWVYRIKLNLDGSISKYKARLVAIGYTQSYGEDYDKTFAPVMKLESLRVLLAIAAKRKLALKQYDVETAYLYGQLDEVIHMEQPKGYQRDANKICLLQKSLYGLKQSGRCWNKKLDAALKQVGLKRLKSDPCIYLYEKGENVLILGAFVDDIIVAGSSEELIDSVMGRMKKSLKLVEMGTPTHILGMRITVKSDGIRLSQMEYARKVVAKYGLDRARKAKTPLDPQCRLG
uniref:Integrase catalytic domain-containing protein n=1 Tax=Strigamia maritima TaxID=126957 RepID=T1JFF8_STRMM